MGGPSSQMKSIAAQQQSFFSTMTANYNQMFAGQQNILNSLKSSWTPILQAGINQYGFSPAEDTALRSQATDTTALQYANAAKAVNNSFAARGGGDAVLPSGTEAQISAGVAETAARQQSQEQLGITEAGYQQGRANYLKAAEALGGPGGIASMMNPIPYAGIANQSGNDAYNSAYQNYQIGQQTGWGGMLGGVLGGVAGSFLGPIGASLGSKVGGMIGGASGGGGGSGLQGGEGDIGSY